VVLAVAHAVGGRLREAARERVVRAYGISALLWTISIWVPPPWRYVLWGIGVSIESGAVLTEDKRAVRRARRERDVSAMVPADPADALDSHHFAERFGLFLIILLGEVVISAGNAAVQGDTAPFSSWAALVAAMLLAAALWWLYFDAAVDLNLRVLDLSGGSPAIARAIFAAGHMLPAFSLLMTAAGLGLLLGGHPPAIAYWLPCVGIGIYLAGTRVFFGAATRAGRSARVLLLVATFLLGTLHDTLSPQAYVWLLAAWGIGCAVLATRGGRFIPAELRG
jgi:low temperature requirement protein LtrA